jgi:2',3'-cyclic-nucleotide 2'-phosphodiesterase (5'-nucleotidase family)
MTVIDYSKSTSARWFTLFLLFVIGLAACRQGGVNTAPSVTGPATAETDPTDEDTVRELTVLYTNDEHGWMEGMEEGEGAANLVGRWREVEDYSPDGPFLILSGGDMWTGPAISSWFDGQSMAEVMNTMGYSAAAVGNHEFDFGLDGLNQRAAESNFPFLSANIRYRNDGSFPTGIGIKPYTIVEVNEIDVGIIGLTTTRTPYTTNPANVSEFEFIDYEEALREIVPEVRAAGAELILVPAHICKDELVDLAGQISDLGIHMLGGGHCNELFAEEVDGIVLLEGGFHLTGYARVTFEFDTATSTVVEANYGINFNAGGPADPQVEEVVAHWKEEVDAELDQVIGYTESGIGRQSQEMHDLIMETWLIGYPAAGIAVTNLGGIRAAFRQGDMTLADVVGVLPFNNVIIEVQLTGSDLFRLLDEDRIAIGGAELSGGNWILKSSGEPIDPDQIYSVLVNDFMYAGGDSFKFLAESDPEGYNTAIDWRQPVIDWLVTQQSTAANPIDAAIRELGS